MKAQDVYRAKPDRWIRRAREACDRKLRTRIGKICVQKARRAANHRLRTFVDKIRKRIIRMQEARDQRVCNAKDSYKVIERYVDEWSPGSHQWVRDRFNAMAERYVQVSIRAEKVRMSLGILVLCVVIGFPLAAVIAFMVMGGSPDTSLQLGIALAVMLVYPPFPGEGTASSSAIKVLHLIGAACLGYFLLSGSGKSILPISSDVQGADTQTLLLLVLTYASVVALATLATVLTLQRIFRELSARLMRPCARHEIVFVLIEVVQAADQESGAVGGEGQSEEIIEKLERISQLLETCPLSPVEKLSSEEKREVTKRFALAAQEIFSYRKLAILPHRTSSTDLRVGVAKFAAAILLEYYGELARQGSGDTTDHSLRAVAFRLVRILLIAITPALALLIVLVGFKMAGFYPENGAGSSFISLATLLAAAWMAVTVLLLLDPSMDQQLRKITYLLSRVWNSLRSGEGKGDKEEESSHDAER